MLSPEPEIKIVRSEQDCINLANDITWGILDFRKTPCGLVAPIRSFMFSLIDESTDGLQGVGFSIGERRHVTTLQVGFRWKQATPLLYQIAPGTEDVVHTRGSLAKAWINFAREIDQGQPPILDLIWSSIHHWNLMKVSWDNLDQPFQVLALAEYNPS
jgi:hypothetical protein